MVDCDLANVSRGLSRVSDYVVSGWPLAGQRSLTKPFFVRHFGFDQKTEEGRSVFSPIKQCLRGNNLTRVRTNSKLTITVIFCELFEG